MIHLALPSDRIVCVCVCVCACVCGGGHAGRARQKSQGLELTPPTQPRHCSPPPLVPPGTWRLASPVLSLLFFTPIDGTASWSLSQSHLPAPFSPLETVEFNSWC